MSEEDVDLFAKIDVGFFSHPKARAAGKNGRELWLASICYCARQETDGRVPKDVLRILAAEADVPASTANRLLSVGAWHDRGDHFEVHDYLEHNRSRESAEAQREAGRQAAAARWSPDRNGSRNANRIADGNTEEEEEEEEDHSRGRAAPFEEGFAVSWEMYPRKVNRKGALKAYQARRRAGVTDNELATATDNYAQTVKGKEPEFILHGATFFGPNERFRDYLGQPSSNGSQEDAWLDRIR